MLHRPVFRSRLLLLIALLLVGGTAAGQPPGDAGAQAAAVGSRVVSSLMARLGVARRRGEPRAVGCLDELVTRANSLRAQIERRALLHGAALRRGDGAEAARQVRLMQRLIERAHQLDGMSANCLAQRVSTWTRVTSIIPLSPRYEPAPL